MDTMKYSDLICARRSVRTFDGKGVSPEDRERLEAFTQDVGNPYGIPMEFRFLNARSHGLKSPVITGTDDYVAVKLKRVPHLEEALGYSMEKFVLEACSIGIGTTWIGGTMDRAAFERAMDLAEDEIMPCVTPIGHAAKRMALKEVAMRKGVGADRRKAFGELFFKDGFDVPLTETEAGQILLPLQMVRLAPSAVNKQPWRIVVAGDKVHFYEKKGKGFNSDSVGDMQKIDMGIALCHFDLAAKEVGLETTFELCDPQIPVPEKTEYIATFRVGKGDIQYRTIRPEDNPALKQLVQVSLKNHDLDIPGTAYFDPFLDKLYEYYTEKPDVRQYFVAVNEQGRVIGGCGVDVFTGIEGCAELQKLYVAEDYQGRGIARHLVGMVEEEARKLGFERIYLETHSNLRAAQQLYQNLGYQLIERPSFAVHATMDLFFIKELLEK